MMRNFLTLARREFTHLAHTPAIYCVLAAMTFFYSFVFCQELALTRQGTLQPVSYLIGVLSLFFVPVLTMRSFAAEEAGGTIELLLTAPVRPVEVAFGKFAGCWAFYVLTLLPLLAYLAVFAWYGEIDRGEAGGVVVGLLLAGGALVATGQIVSALTANVIVAAAGGCVANFFFFMLAMPVDTGASPFSFPAQLSWWSHFKEVWARGLLDTRSITFSFSYLALGLFLLWLIVASRGRFGRGGVGMKRWAAPLAGLCVLLGVNLFLFGGWAREGWKSLSSALAAGDLFGAGWPVTAGAGLVLAALLILRLGRREKREKRGRRIAGEWPVWLAAVAAVLIVLNLNYLSTSRIAGMNLYARWDLTEGGHNTLSPDLRRALDLLETPVEFTAFFSEGTEYDGVPLARRVRDLLGEMTGYSPKVRVKILDALASPEEAREAARRMELPPNELDRIMTMEYAGRRLVLPATLLLRAPDEQERMAGEKRGFFQGEMALAVALRRISDQRTTRILFTSGHGEYAFGKMGREPQAVGTFAEALGREACEVRPWFFNGTEDVPAGCDVLALIAPQVPFSPEALARLRKYLDNGGRMLLLLPSAVQMKENEPLSQMMGWLGIRMRADLVVDEKNNFAGQPNQILALLEPGAAPETGLQQTVLVMPDARSLQVSEEEGRKNGWKVWRLVRSLRAAKRMEAADKKLISGAVTVAAAGARPSAGNVPEGRVVVAGCAGMASNLFIESENNRIFLLRACQWLAGRDYSVKMHERIYPDYRLSINADGLRLIWWLLVIALPEVWLLAALAVWWMRRD